ncbi:MAG: response regulator [Magnetococcales bacterium]|nr:response regulator [Magnetococcales bacterium]MBF0151374.1 response regulator [Magnetococcales bacterium]MBF0174254.1 response regulator [Magnetococcales bacterium]
MDKSHVSRILIVDDEFLHRLPMSEALRQAGFRVEEAEGGLHAWTLLQQERYDLVITDVVMPGMDGFELCETVRRKEEFRHLPIVMATSLDDLSSIERAYQAGATDFITKPIHWGLLGYRMHYILRAARIAQTLADRESELLRTRMEIIRRLGQAAEYRDNETGQHIHRMSHYSALMGQAYGLSRNEQELLQHAAPMHDVGKIGIPDSILLKPGKLTDEEFAIMKTHTTLGGELLDQEPSLLMRTAHTIALTHHERWDGNGYPHGLARDAIPLLGRICSLADVFDALTSKRPYKQPWTVERALDEINQCSGTAFDPHLVRIFFDILPDILKIKAKFSDPLHDS